MAGIFITFEGGEASGKSTQVARLKKRLEFLGSPVIGLHDPGGTDLGEAIRELLLHARSGKAMLPETELLLFCASRAQLAGEVIAPALSSGRNVVCDRFTDSTLVYQGFGRGLSRPMIEKLAEFCAKGLKPDRTIVLDLDLATARRRQLRRVRPADGSDRIESQPEEFFERVRTGYLELCKMDPGRVKLVDGAGLVEQVEQAIWNEVHGFFE
jgi:dTMP kinase